jgi:hypothetical protein
MFSIFCRGLKFLSFGINALNMCLIIVQTAETALKQGKIADTDKLSADLSTGFVDGLTLAQAEQRLQRLPENHTV